MPDSPESLPYLSPRYIGTEEETMLSIGSSFTELGSPEKFIKDHQHSLPENIKVAGNYKYYLQNGAMVYDGGNDSYERATPECSSPYQAAQYSIAGEQLLIDTLTNYVKGAAELDEPIVARAHRRVIDSFDNTKACHDNFSIAGSGFLKNHRYGKDRSAFVRHLATRSIVTGAGNATETAFYTAQKARTVSEFNYYGYKSSVFRVADYHNQSHEERLEVRCSDINISPWANQVRLGSMMLLLAALRTPLVEEIDSFTPAVTGDEEAKTLIKSYAQLDIDNDANIVRSSKALLALDFQQRLAELYAEKLPHHAEVSDELLNIAHEIIYFCQDFKNTLSEGGDPTVLADRADFALKLRLIKRSTALDRSYGITRTPLDFSAQAIDMKYDVIKVSPNSLGNKTAADVVLGAGIKLRNKGFFRMPIKPADVQNAYYLPPTDTRAFTRGTAVRRSLAGPETSWSSVATVDHAGNERVIVLNPGEGHKDSNQLAYIEHFAKQLRPSEQLDEFEDTNETSSNN